MTSETTIESWWRHNGCWDREQVSGIPYKDEDDYLLITDEWWDSLSIDEKREKYDEFFSEE